MKIGKFLVAAAVCGLMAGTARAEDVAVKLGVLNDMSGVYADISGPGSIVAAQMAADEFMAKNKGLQGRGHRCRPPEQAGRRRLHRPQVVRPGECGRHHGRHHLLGGAGGERHHQREEQDLPRLRRRHIRTSPAPRSPNTVHWTYDTWALANGTGSALTKQGGSPWSFITADYAFGAALERDASAAVKAAGGKVAGSVKHPLSNTDFSSFLLQAQSSGAKVIGLANAGNDLITAVKQASEFGITQGGQQLAGLLIFSSDVKALGLQEVLKR